MLPDLGYLDYCSRSISINDVSERGCEVLRFAIKSNLAGVHIGFVVRSKWNFLESLDAVVPWWNAEYCCRASRVASSTVTGHETYDTDDKIETAYRHHDGIADWCGCPDNSIKCPSLRTEIVLGQSAMWRHAGA